ncbi:MAG TPA: ABC transporter permease [Pyrinomonadaceae bacterium]|nr:ABC transporter permease [Pyrinomonadaceae bacterium]
MFWLRLIYSRLYGLLRKNRVEQEMDDEMRFHLLMRTRQNIERGMRPDEAEREARRRFGNVGRIKDLARDIKGGGFMETLLQDLRYGARMLRKRPGFTFIALVTLSLGIGVNTALFTVFNVFVLQPLPVKDPHSLVEIRGVNQRGYRENLFSYLDYLDYRRHSRTLAGLALWSKLGVTAGDMRSGRDDVSWLREEFGYVSAEIVTANYFTALGAEMALGRGFLEEEDRTPLARPVTVLSYFFWQRHFNGDPNVIGKTIKLAGRPFTVVGVTAKEFIGATPGAPAAWIPLMMHDAVVTAGMRNHKRWLTERDADEFLMIGRLKPGATPEQARAELNLITAQFAEQKPDKQRKAGVTVKSSPGFISIPAEDWADLLLAPVSIALVLLIACANVANLLLARASERQKEIGVRLALGASRWRIVRQLLTESVLVAALGGLAGLPLAGWTLKALYLTVMARLPGTLRDSVVLNLDPDYRVFGFTLLMALLAGLAAGLAPAVQASRPNLNSAIKDEGSSFGQHLSQSRLRNGLIVAQISVSLTLLIGAGLLARNLQKLQTIETGMEVKNLFSVVADLSEPDPPRQMQLRRQLADRLRALPGVQSVSHALRQPLSGSAATTPITLNDQARQSDQPLRAKYNFVSPTHLATLGVPLLRGRNFSEQEANAGAPVVVVSESTVRKLWPDLKDSGAAIGKRIGIGAAALKADPDNMQAKADDGLVANNFPQYEVIGVAGDTRSGGVTQPDDTFLYVPLKTDSAIAEYLIVRTLGDPGSVMAAVRGEAVALDPRLKVALQRTAENLDLQIVPFRIAGSIATALGLIALFLAAVGLYGVMSFVVTQRTREIGIRLALGAEPRAVVALFVRQNLRVIACGVALGLAGGAGISRLLAAALVDLSPLDPLAFGGVSVGLTLVALLACWIPARRATKVDPMSALHCE